MEETLDISSLLKTLKKHFVAVVTIALVMGIAAFLVSNFLITKKYESTAMLYVENSQNTSESVNINDINAAQKLVNTCQILFKSGTALDTLIENLELPYTKKELSEMITAASVNGTEVMKLVVESEDPVEAQIIVNELVDISQSEFKRIIKSGSIEIVELGEISTVPSSPDVKLITLIGFALGLVMAYAIFFIRDMLDVAVKHDDNLAKMYDVPVFAEIMEFDSATSGGKYGYSNYGYGRKSRRARTSDGKFSERLLSDNTPFAISEAYNSARTNTMFAVAHAPKKIIAVTSSNPSEGKSTTCSNLAISFANAGFEVLLVECDLRKPTMANNFSLTNKMGLSAILGGFCSVTDALNSYVLSGLDIITAGEIPPNPSELLGSEAMKSFLIASAQNYDYVFLDTPPVNVVTDSQLMNEDIAGIVFTIREDDTTHPDIQNAMDKIKLANGKTLGFIKTFCKPEKSGRYSKKYSYKSGYGYGYGDGGSETKKEPAPTATD